MAYGRGHSGAKLSYLAEAETFQMQERRWRPLSLLIRVPRGSGTILDHDREPHCTAVNPAVTMDFHEIGNCHKLPTSSADFFKHTSQNGQGVWESFRVYPTKAAAKSGLHIS